MLNMKRQIIYISNFSFINSESEIDVSQIPPLIRRKLNLFDKIALTTLCRAYKDEAEEIIFTSQYGERSRLDTIIEQYTTQNEVSPAQFSASVHNYIAGFFTLYKKLNIPYSALSAGKNSISAGIVKSLVSEYENVLFSYADAVDGVKSVSCIISKTGGDIKCVVSSPGKDTGEFEGFIDFLDGRKDVFQSSLLKIERV